MTNLRTQTNAPHLFFPGAIFSRFLEAKNTPRLRKASRQSFIPLIVITHQRILILAHQRICLGQFQRGLFCRAYCSTFGEMGFLGLLLLSKQFYLFGLGKRFFFAMALLHLKILSLTSSATAQLNWFGDQMYKPETNKCKDLQLQHFQGVDFRILYTFVHALVNLG